MTNLFLSLFLILLMNSELPSDASQIINESLKQGQEPSVLVFSKTAGFRHDSIEAGIDAVKQLGSGHGFSVTATEDSDYFTPENLGRYAVVIFMNTTGTLFDEDQRAAFKQFIQNGGGFVGVHSATDTEYDWPWYGGLVGAYFANHPNNPNVRNAELIVTDRSHLSTLDLPEPWIRDDEWYNFGTISDAIQVVVKLDTDSYEGSDHPGNHPASWFQEYDGGRAFYTAMGHTSETFSEPVFLKHLLGGIHYAMGRE
ncbi:MAG: ThuA domain-containing protein [Balneolaceae bacterium]|nr:MAG: ThuA domain-containing protein [Balneolaceae bacterium]